MWADRETERQVLAAVDAFLDDLKNRRLEPTLARFTGDDDCSVFGSEVGEEAIGPDGLRRFFTAMYERPSSFSVSWRSRRVSISGNTAWLSSEVDAHMSTSDRSASYRITGILVRRGDDWLLQLYHGSEPKGIGS